MLARNLPLRRIPPAVVAAVNPNALFEMLIEGTGAAANTIFTFAHPFALGQVPAATPLLFRRVDNNAEIRTQVEWKTTWAGGSLKHGLIAIELPAVADGVTLALKCITNETHSSPGSNLTIDAITLATRSASITFTPNIGTAVTVDIKAAAIAASGAGDWRLGPLVREVRVTGTIASTAMGASAAAPYYNSTGGRYVVDFWLTKNGDVFLDSQFRNDGAAWPDTGLIQANFAPKVTIDAVDVFTAAATLMNVYTGGCRIRGRTSGGASASYWPAFIRPSTDYLRISKFAPRYKVGGTVAAAVTTLFTNARAASTWNDWSTRSAATRGLIDGGPSGDNENIYGIPFGQAGAAWVIAGHKDAQQYAMDQAEGMHQSTHHLWDKTNGKWVNRADRAGFRPHYQNANFVPNNPGTFQADTAHWPQVVTLPYMLRGRRSCLDTMTAHCARMAADAMNNVQDGSAAWADWNDLQERAVGYSICEMALCLAMLPTSDALASYLSSNLDGNFQYLLDLRAALDTELGTVTGMMLRGGLIDLRIWQQDIALQATLLAKGLGWTKATTWATWQKNFMIDMMLQTGVNWPFNRILYDLRARATAGGAAYNTKATFIAANGTFAPSSTHNSSTNDQQYARNTLKTLRWWKEEYPADTEIAAALTAFATMAPSGVALVNMENAPKTYVDVPP